MRWPVAATITIILSQSLGFVDSSGQAGALEPGAAVAAIAMISIAPTFLVVLASSFDLGKLRAMRRHGSYLLRAEWKETFVLGVILGRFWGGAMAPGAASIYLVDPQKKVQSGFSFSRNGHPNGLVAIVFLMTFLLGLARMDGLGLSRNRGIKTGSKITMLASNSGKTVCKYYR